MEERKAVQLKKEEFAIRESLKEFLGKGKVSRIKIIYTPIGEKIVISTHKPGLVIGRKGAKIEEITHLIKSKYKLENPQIEIEEISKPEFDAQINADEIALALERFGPLKFKVTAYRTLQRIIKAGALGVEIKLNGKLPSKRARHWKFSQGYLKKTGDSAKVVDRAQARAETRPGTVGVTVSILAPDAELKDKIKIDEKFLAKIETNRSKFEIKNIKDEKESKKVVKSKPKKGTSNKKVVAKKEKSIDKEEDTLKGTSEK